MVMPLFQINAVFNQRLRCERVFRDRTSPFDCLSEREFKSHYRFDKLNAHAVIELFRGPLEPVTQRNHALSAQEQILTTLHFLGSNSLQRDDARIAGIKQQSVCRIVHKVVRSIALRLDEFVQFPTGNLATEAEAGFASLAVLKNLERLPGVVSAVDGSHIPLEGSPCNVLPGIYYNRKGFYSINAQFVCDADMRCTNVVAKWYGSAHDSRIFQNSRLCQRFQSGEYQGMLLTDSAYPGLNFVLKPIHNPATPQEIRYNKSQIKSRTVIKQFNGILKNRFRCLKGLRVQIANTEPIIVACVILHNLCIMLQDNDPPDDCPNPNQGNDDDNDDDDEDNQFTFPMVVRQQYIRNNFI